jgi:drug/metabolite transporter (DMT)-like permease
MGYPAGSRSRPPKPPMSGPDLAVSISALVLTVMLGIAAAVFGMFSLAFLDHCPPESCSAEDAVTSVATALVIAVAIGIAGLAATIIALYRRMRAWPFAIATLVLCLIAFVLGGVGYAVAVGA